MWEAFYTVGPIPPSHPPTPLHPTPTLLSIPLSALLYSSDRPSWKINLWKEKGKKIINVTILPLRPLSSLGSGGQGKWSLW